MSIFLRSYLKKISASFIFLTAIFFAHASFAQIKFSVVCPDKKIGKNDLLQVQFKVEGASDVDNITPPSFQDFNIVSGPNQQRSVTNINGKISQSVSICFSLQPTSTGKFTIGSATAIADGHDYKTNPITIEVVAGSIVQQNSGNQNSSPFPNLNFDFPPAPVAHQFDDYILKPGENVAEKIKKNIFIKLDVDKKSCYVGEPVVATYKLYTRLPSETNVTDAPSFNGFSVSDIDVNNNAVPEKYNGRLYNVYTMRKVQLYPLQPGNITLDPVVADNKITFIKSQYANSQQGSGFFDMFDNLGQAALPPEAQIDQNVILKSTPIVITVKPLPSENKPIDFRGAVGDFTITASLEKNKITTDDAGTLKLTVSGKGNIQLINAPSITWPKGIDGYDAKVRDNVDKGKVPMQGSKVFSFPFTVSKPGNYTIDSISFSYFDPQTSTYKTLHTSALQVEVKKGKGIHINPLVKTSQQNDTGDSFTKRTELIAGIVFVIGIIFLIIFLIIKKNRNKDDLEREIKVDDLKNEAGEVAEEFMIPESPLTGAHEKLVQRDSKSFYHTLDASLKKYLSSKLNIPANELSRKRLTEELDKCNVSLNTSLMLTSLMDEIEMNLYAPASNMNELNTVFEKASEVVSLLDKQVC